MEAQTPYKAGPQYIEIKLTKCRLFLTEAELQKLLARDPALWRVALKRGKAVQRARDRRHGKVKAGMIE